MAEKPRVVKLPASIDGAKTVLGNMGSFINAREWERAAIVATYVFLPDSGPEVSTSGRMSARQFAELEIYGLRSVTTVTKLVRRWRGLGVGHPEPGMEVVIPNKPWADEEGVIAIANERRLAREADAAAFKAKLTAKTDEIVAKREEREAPDTTVHTTSSETERRTTTTTTTKEPTLGQLALIQTVKVAVDSMERLGMHAELREALAYIDSKLSVKA